MMSGGSRRVVFATRAGCALSQIQSLLIDVRNFRHAKVESVGLVHLDVLAYVAIEHKLVFDDWWAGFARAWTWIYMKFQVLRFHFFRHCS